MHMLVVFICHNEIIFQVSSQVLQIYRMVLAQCSSYKQNPKKVGRSSGDNPHFVFEGLPQK